MAESIPLFELCDVSLHYPREKGQVQTVLDHAAAAIRSDGITCVVGPSGSGKSSLLRLLNRLEEPNQGLIRFQGEPLTVLDPLQLRKRVALVAQVPTMLPGTVRDNLEAGLRLRGRRLTDPECWLDRVGLPGDFLGKQARDLSGGEKQRIALIRALAAEPQVVLLDEVTAPLDAASTQLVEELIRGLKISVVWVTHDQDQVQRVATQVLRVENGQIREVAL